MCLARRDIVVLAWIALTKQTVPRFARCFFLVVHAHWIWVLQAFIVEDPRLELMRGISLDRFAEVCRCPLFLKLGLLPTTFKTVCLKNQNRGRLPGDNALLACTLPPLSTFNANCPLPPPACDSPEASCHSSGLSHASTCRPSGLSHAAAQHRGRHY